MLDRAEELEQRVRETPLLERLVEARSRIGKMCSEGRPPRMTIPVQHDDDDFYISTTLADAQATMADLQGQVEAAKAKLVDYETKTYCAFCGQTYLIDTGAELIARHIKECPKHPMRDVEQRVAQLEAWQDGVVKAFLEAPLEWSPGLGVPHIPTCLPQIFRNMKDYADKLTTLQADHARVLGLLAQVTEIADMMLKGTECEHDVGLCSCEHRRIVKQAQRSLPAQPAQGGAHG